MDFSTAYISMQMGHKIKRKHWNKTQYWFMLDGVVYRYGFISDGLVEEVAKTNNLFANVACNDWEIADDGGVDVEIFGKKYKDNQFFNKSKVSRTECIKMSKNKEEK